MADFSHSRNNNLVKPKIYTEDNHSIKKHDIDKNALFVLEKLRSAGFTAYLVGGGVRDLLLKKTPKDFDISTSARPEQVRRVFKHCFLIGKRFRLAHVRFGKKVIEVATFRSGNIDEEELITRDNNWGSPEEDALRRDFTINGLFYDSDKGSIIDYFGGVDDLQQHLLKTIGDPNLRFKQDPVRMIRLLKFMARFELNVDPDTLKALESCRYEIVKSSPARILEEILKMLESGSSAPFFKLMQKHGFFKILIPKLHDCLCAPQNEKIFSYLREADKLTTHPSSPSLQRGTLLACIFFPILEKKVQNFFLEKGCLANLGDIFLIAQDLINNVIASSFSHFPKKLKGQLLDILITQYRMTPLKSRIVKSKKILNHTEFTSSLQFLKIRSLIDDKLLNTYNSWMQRKNKQIPENTPPSKEKLNTK
jgi:poly(A) polymerase